MTALYLLFLLLPLAFLGGWWLARGVPWRARRATNRSLASDYFRGLNYLLNEERDKALEVFLRLAEYGNDTVETQLALGNLFRRRGEVDRAIHIHQNLIARPGLGQPIRAAALLELGEDYMRAGLLDRAEALFTDLAAMDSHAPEALRHLVAIYQHERDWHEAIRRAQRLESVTGESQAHPIAHFYCELAERSIQHGAHAEARDYLDSALASKPDCARAFIAKGHIDLAENAYQAAMIDLEQAVSCQPALLPDFLPSLLDAYARADERARAEAFLGNMIEHYRGISPVLALARVYAERDGERAAVDFLTDHLRRRPSVRGMMALVDITLARTEGELHQDFVILRELTHKLLEGQPMYRCNHCGFSAKAHHWQCPSCKLWGTVLPIHGVANE